MHVFEPFTRPNEQLIHIFGSAGFIGGLFVIYYNKIL